METWFLISITFFILLLLKPILDFLRPSITKSTSKPKLPPGPTSIPIISNVLWLGKSFADMEPILRNLKAKYGPIITIRIGSRPAIFIANRSLAHQALIENGAVFADRPTALTIDKIGSSNQHSISSASYGPTWRLLRRNLTSEILHPSRVKSYGGARKWVLDILISQLKSASLSEDQVVKLVDHFQYAMFCLLVLMCFGDKLDENQIKKIETVLRRALLSFGRFDVLNFWPKLTKILFKKRWDEFLELRKEKQDVLIPLIRARQKFKHQSKDGEKDDDFVLSYVDTLLGLEIPDEKGKGKRKLSEDELVTLCSEFIDGGTDTTSTALEWIMANIIKYPEVQDKLFAEIKGVVGETEELKEEVLQKLPYLKAVILEGLRRHPPGHFVLPHAVTQDVVLGGHVVPKNGTVNIMVSEIGWDPEVWEDPKAFKPERFLSGGVGEGFDLTGSREIKMMPFGAGRRICPASGLAVLHLEYFVANLIWKFEWRAVEGDDVDLSEKQKFTVVMKKPLKANLSPRLK